MLSTIKYPPNQKTKAKKPLKISNKILGESGPSELKESHHEFITYLENLDETIKNVLNRHKTLIKGRYLSATQHLEKVRKNLIAYQEKMVKLQKEMNENETINYILSQIKNFKEFYEILQINLKDLDNVIHLKEEESLEKLQRMRVKKTLLLQVHQENIQLSIKILSFKKNFPSLIIKVGDQPIIEDPSPNHSSKVKIKRIKKEYTSLKYEVENISASNAIQKAELSKKSNHFIQTKQLLQEALKALNKSLLFSQQITNHTGLKNSLLFKIKPEISKTNTNFKSLESKSFLQDREINNVVFSTLKKVVKDRKIKPKSDWDGLELSWEEFKDFSPLQIIGLMSMNGKALEGIFTEFEIKERKINEFFNKIKAF